MRLAALQMMRLLRPFRPRLIGSVLTGHIRSGSDIDLHVFSDSVESVNEALAREGMAGEVERKQVRREGETCVFRHIHVWAEYPFELTVYGSKMAHHVFKSSITGKAIERATTAELEQFLHDEYPGLDLEQSLRDAAEQPDRFQVFEALLLPLELVKQNPDHHPEGDALYHSLQVFDLACYERGYDEEFLTAALLHDVGKAIDPTDHVGSGLEALEDLVSDRTAWLIEHHMLSHKIAVGAIGRRKHARLRESPNYADLVLLGECDRAGRKPGAHAPDLDEAIEYLRELSRMCQ